MAESTDELTAAATSFALGQMSFRYTGLPSLPVPKDSVVISILRLPASAEATTKGGDAKKFILISGCTRPSKLRLPDSPAQATTSPVLTASEISGFKGPELPIHVVHP